MAAKEFMDITTTSSLFLLLLVVPTGARYLSGEAIETQPGITAMDGISPVPTEAPGFHGIPKELRKRATQNSDDYPPSNWCGFIDGNTQIPLTCPPNTSCIVKSNFYVACGCTSLNTDLCFRDLPTTCVNYDVDKTATRLGTLTKPCDDTYLPYCLTFISSGLSPAFSCDSTSSPRTHSFVPLAAYYPSLSPTPSTTLPDASSIPTTESSHDKAKPSKLSTSKRAGIGIGIGTGLGTPGVIFVIVLYFRRKQKRTRASPTAGDAERVIAQTKNTPPGHQSAVQPVQQYQPHSENITFPEPANMPPSPGPS